MERVLTDIEIKNLYDNIFFKKFKVQQAIGVGTFGAVFEGINITNQQKVAIKIEKKIGNESLLNESSFLMSVQGHGIPKVISFGISGKYYVLVMELLGKSLDKITKPMCLKDVCIIAIQILDRLEFIHSRFILHRDIKPTNFLLDKKNESTIYLIDFGVAKKFRSSNTKKHIKYENIRRLTGTPEFSSLNATSGYSQSRRDELESLGYMLIYLIKGKLPWIIEKKETIEQKIKEIKNIKKNTPASLLCENLPEEFAEYINYTKQLKFEQDPDYEYLRNLFKKIMLKNNFILDMKFSWMEIEDKERPNSCFSKTASKKNDLSSPKPKASLHNRIYNKIKESLIKQNSSNNISSEKKVYNPLKGSKNKSDNCQIFIDIRNKNEEVSCNKKQHMTINLNNFNNQNNFNNIILSPFGFPVLINNENKNQIENTKLIVNNIPIGKNRQNEINISRKLSINQPNNQISMILNDSLSNSIKNENSSKDNLSFNGNNIKNENKEKKKYFSKVVSNLKLEKEFIKGNNICAKKINKNYILKKNTMNNKIIKTKYIDNSDSIINNLTFNSSKSIEKYLKRQNRIYMDNNNSNKIINNSQRYMNFGYRATNTVSGYSVCNEKFYPNNPNNYYA